MASDFVLEVGDQHRIVLEFGDGTFMTKLIHPEGGGCGTADRCGQCGRSYVDPDPETKPCYDCPDDPAKAAQECWVQGWFDECMPDEILHGSVEVVVEPKWEFDHCELHIVGAAMPAKARSAADEREREPTSGGGSANG